MDRRAFLGALAVLAAPLGVDAQQVGKVNRIGILSPGASSRGQLYMFEALGELGYVEGGNLAVDTSSTWLRGTGFPRSTSGPSTPRRAASSGTE
jgi:hypothetical protein